MARTPGLIIPSAYSSKDELEKDLRRRDEAAGFTPFDPAEFDEDVLEHFGVKGMKWGRRKQRSDEDDRKATFQNADRNRKIKVGIAVAGGALAVGLILSKRGRTKAIDAATTNYVQSRNARFQASKNPFGALAQKFRDTKAAAVPSPDRLIADARMAGVRNAVNREGNQRITERAWRDSANLRRQARDMDNTTNSLLRGNNRALDLAETRRRLADPNYVWQL